jgi:hypothetical protein
LVLPRGLEPRTYRLRAGALGLLSYGSRDPRDGAWGTARGLLGRLRPALQLVPHPGIAPGSRPFQGHANLSQLARRIGLYGTSRTYAKQIRSLLPEVPRAVEMEPPVVNSTPCSSSREQVPKGHRMADGCELESQQLAPSVRLAIGATP